MTLRRLQVFVCVANHLNVTQAAHDLRTSQPAVTQALGRLAKDVGATLLSRNGRGIQLTEAGSKFRRDAQAVLALIEEMEIKYRSAEKLAPPNAPAPREERSRLTYGRRKRGGVKAMSSDLV